MLERLAGNTALKSELGAALGAGRLPHAILLVGEPGCGAGFAARCLAADYLYPQGGPHAEAVLKKEDTECLVLQGEGASGQIAVKRVREMREAIQRSALSTDAAGRVLFIYGAQNLNGSSANAMLKIIEEPPEGVLFVLTATSAATVLPTIRSRCAAYTIAPVPTDECAALLTREGLPARLAQELAFLYEGHIGTALQAFRNDTFKAALGLAKELCSYAAQNDTYRTLVLVTKYERDRESFLALLWQLDQLCSAVLLSPAYGAEQCGGLTPDRAARILQVSAATRKTVTGNGNLRLAVAVFAAIILIPAISRSKRATTSSLPRPAAPSAARSCAPPTRCRASPARSSRSSAWPMRWTSAACARTAPTCSRPTPSASSASPPMA